MAMPLDFAQLKQELVAELRLEQLPEEKRDALLAKMGEAVLRRIFLETVEKIGDEGVKEYETLLEKSAKKEEIDAFFESKIPGYNVFVRDIVEDFKHDMKKGV